MNHCTAAVLACTVLIAALPAGAETVYISREFKAGLHEDKSLDAPIAKLVSSGTPLEIVKREEAMSFVRDADGATGWIDNSYLTAEAPTDSEELKKARERADLLDRRLSDAKQEIVNLQAQVDGSTPVDGESARLQTLRKQNADLEQQLKQERLRAGELEVQVAGLKKRIGMTGENADVYAQLEQLEAEKKKLEVALAGGERTEAGGGTDTGGGWMPALSPGRMAIAAGILLLLGFIGGMYVLDLVNRRRHGGFRV